jgi:2,4-didehydro-3-deoxy-L-rhamnonate hydrolase
MICHVVHYLSGDETTWGILYQQRVFALPGYYPSTRAFLETGRADAYTLLQDLQAREHPGSGVALEHLTLLSPVTGDARVICQGVNYREHQREVGMDPDDANFNMFFNKSSASICASGVAVQRPANVELLDYEIELGLVIHGEMRKEENVTRERLHEFVAGVVIANDLSARDVQLAETQFYKGKSYRGFCPLGPVLCLLEAEDMHYLEQLQLELRVNGQLRQWDNTANMVCKPAETLTELSLFSDLTSGDLILTGTPHGCALQVPRNPIKRLIFNVLPERRKWPLFVAQQKKSGDYLQPGDTMTLRIKSSDGAVDLGTQTTSVK